MKDERVGNGEIVRVKKEWEKNKYIYRERVGEGNIECVRVSEKWEKSKETKERVVIDAEVRGREEQAIRERDGKKG